MRVVFGGVATHAAWATITAVAAKAAATARTLFTRTRLVDRQIAVAEAITIEAFDRFLAAFIGCHLNKAEPLWAACFAVSDEGYLGHFSGFGEQCTNLFLGGVVRHIANI